MTHTTGPWNYSLGSVYTQWRQLQGASSYHHLICQVAGSGNECDANGTLIATAPDLLAAHKRIAQKAGALADDHHTWVYNTDEGQEIMRLVREIGAEAEAAIAKAKGESQ